MKATKSQAKRLGSAIAQWENDALITNETASSLRDSLQVVGFDWKGLARYSFWTSVVCFVIAVAALLADKLIEPILIAIFGNYLRGYCAIFGLIGVALFCLGLYRKRKKPEGTLGNESIFLLGVLSLAASLGSLSADLKYEHASLFFLVASIVYSALGLWFPSKLVWIFALLSLGAWFGAETGYLSGWGSYYLGMNYPVRFVFFGAALTGSSFLFFKLKRWQYFHTPTRVVGMLYLFIALWILSIFGNYGDWKTWQAVKQWELFHWSLLFGVCSIAAIYLGVKYEDRVARGFGITFLFINLYTRFFEYSWDHLHKAIIFTILAISFWYLGSRAERIWNVRIRSNAPDKLSPTPSPDKSIGSINSIDKTGG